MISALNCTFFIDGSSRAEYGIEDGEIWRGIMEECKDLYHVELEDEISTKNTRVFQGNYLV